MSEEKTVTQRYESNILKSIRALGLEEFYLGRTLGNGDLYFFENNHDAASYKRLYVIVFDSGSRTEVINVYDGVTQTFSSGSSFNKSASTGTIYQRDMVMDLIVSCFISNIKPSPTDNSIRFGFFSENNCKPENGEINFQGVKINVYNEYVTVSLPNFNKVAKGRIKTLPMFSPAFTWLYDDKKEEDLDLDLGNIDFD